MTNKFVSKKDYSVNGVKGKLSTYQESETSYPEEGKVLEAAVNKTGNYFTFRLAFNSVMYPQGEQAFMDILESVRFLQ